MLITAVAWEQVREHFSDDEKQQLREATDGESICPRGAFVDEERLSEQLRRKLKALAATIHHAQRGLR
jgi:hypothetical protein